MDKFPSAVKIELRQSQSLGFGSAIASVFGKMFRVCFLLLLSAWLLTPTQARADEAVLLAQQSLSRLQLYDGPIDGTPGPGTTAAVQRYQVRVGLPATGNLDAETVAALETAATVLTLEFVTWSEPMVGAEVGPDSFEALSVSEILVGSPLESAPAWKQREAVRVAQRRLETLGYESGGSDGVPGPKTRTAIAEFQNLQSLAETGLIDGPTYAALGITEEELSRTQSDRDEQSGENAPGFKKRFKRSFKKALWHVGL